MEIYYQKSTFRNYHDLIAIMIAIRKDKLCAGDLYSVVYSVH